MAVVAPPESDIADIRRCDASGRDGRRVGTIRLSAARAVPGAPLVNRDGGSRQTCREEQRCDENCNPLDFRFMICLPLGFIDSDNYSLHCLTQRVCMSRSNYRARARINPS